MTQISSTNSTALQTLIDSLRAVVQAEPEAARAAEGVARTLHPYLGNPDLLRPEQCEPDPAAYRQHILHVEPDGSFSVVALVWLPGQVTPIHDHVSWCVVGVHQGEEHEVRYRLVDDNGTAHLVEDGSGVNPRTSVAALTPPGDIHLVANHCGGVAISLHVYGADIGKLGSSIRRRYDLEVKAAS